MHLIFGILTGLATTHLPIFFPGASTWRRVTSDTPSCKSLSRSSTCLSVSFSLSLVQLVKVFFCTSTHPLSAKPSLISSSVEKLQREEKRRICSDIWRSWSLLVCIPEAGEDLLDHRMIGMRKTNSTRCEQLNNNNLLKKLLRKHGYIVASEQLDHDLLYSPPRSYNLKRSLILAVKTQLAL